MRGDSRARFCNQCGKHVYNVENWSERELDHLLAGGDEMPCLRLCCDRDGEIITRDTPLSRRTAARLRRWIACAAAIVLTQPLLGCIMGVVRQREQTTMGRPLCKPLTGSVILDDSETGLEPTSPTLDQHP